MATINGTTTNDMLDGGADDDVLNGFEGDDSLAGAGGDDVLIGGPGDDTLDGGDGEDIADYAAAAAGVSVNLAVGTAADGDGGTDRLTGIEGAIGSAFDDVFRAGAGVNFFRGGAGDDEIIGNGQTILDYGEDATARIIADLSTGGVAGDASVGEDTVSGIGSIVATPFDDVLLGSNAGDTFEGLAGADVIDGRGGVDRASYEASMAGVTVNLADGVASDDGFGSSDVLFGIEQVEGSGFDDRLTGDGNANILLGAGGDDILIGGAGADDLDGGDGVDTADYSAATDSIDANLAGGTIRDGGGATDRVVAIEAVIGGSGDDRLRGDDEDNTLNGGAGDDVLDGGAGSDALIGGAGDDRADYSSQGAGVTVDLLNRIVTEADGAMDMVGADIETITGSNFADMVILGDGATVFDGGGGADVIDASGFAGGAASINLALGTALDGALRLRAPVNVENVMGSALADTLTGDDLANGLDGGDGDDSLIGGRGADALNGGAGQDTIIWNNGDGSDQIDGGDDRDTLIVNGAAAAGDAFALTADGDGAAFQRSNLIPFQLDIASVEAVTVNGGGGRDSLAVGDLAETGVEETTFNGGDGDDVLVGGDATSRIVASGGAGADRFSAGAADDRLIGGAGDDILNGGDGADRMFGNGGADQLRGDAGDDQLSGASGDDILRGGLGDDFLNGGAGIDRADFSDATMGVTVDLDAGMAEDGSGGVDTFSEPPNSDGGTTIEGAIGSDFDDLFLSDSTAYFDGGLGVDTVDLSGFTGPLDVDLTTGAVRQMGLTAGALTGIETVIGTDAADSIAGDAADNLLIGGAGDDMLLGAAGDDILRGGAGDDDLMGGAGFDTADYAMAAMGISVDLRAGVFMDGDGGQDSVTDVEAFSGSAFNDVFIGDAGANVFTGGDGNDRFIGRQGADRMTGGAGNDVYFVDDAGDRVVEAVAEGGSDRINTAIDFDNVANVEVLVASSRLGSLSLNGADGGERIVGSAYDDDGDRIDGGAGADRIVGLVGNDMLRGGAGDDRIFGNSGMDLIVGGAGDDRLTGQFDADTFVHAMGDGNDRITDFDVTEDMLDLRGHNFTSFAQVQALFSDAATGAFLDLAGDDGVLFDGVAANAFGQEDILI